MFLEGKQNNWKIPAKKFIFSKVAGCRPAISLQWKFFTGIFQKFCWSWRLFLFIFVNFRNRYFQETPLSCHYCFSESFFKKLFLNSWAWSLKNTCKRVHFLLNLQDEGWRAEIFIENEVFHRYFSRYLLIFQVLIYDLHLSVVASVHSKSGPRTLQNLRLRSSWQ